MNRRLIAVLTFALVVSGLASLIVYRLVLANVAQASVRQLQHFHLLVASHNLEAGALIEAADLKSIDVTTPSSSQVVTDAAQAVGRGVIAPIYEGEPIHLSRLAPVGAGAGLSSMIPIGMRAVALRVNEVVGLAGFVVPGMRVDVIVSGSGGLDRSVLVSRTVLQNIEVLSAGQKYERRPDGKPEEAQVVNLLVTPAQAEVMTLASGETKVQLVLRNPLDKSEGPTPGTSLANILGISQKPVPTLAPSPGLAPPAVARAESRPAPQPETVEVFSGSKRADQQLTFSSKSGANQ